MPIIFRYFCETISLYFQDNLNFEDLDFEHFRSFDLSASASMRLLVTAVLSLLHISFIDASFFLLWTQQLLLFLVSIFVLSHCFLFNFIFLLDCQSDDIPLVSHAVAGGNVAVVMDLSTSKYKLAFIFELHVHSHIHPLSLNGSAHNKRTRSKLKRCINLFNFLSFGTAA